MNTFLKLALLFIAGSTAGWAAELLYRRTKHKKWINPGFLAGPSLPLYGCGLMGLYLLCRYVNFSFVENPALRYVAMILTVTVFMTVLEYLTGLVFIKGMKVKLWDYSDRRGNIQGIICPTFTLVWALAGALYILFVHSKLEAFLRRAEGNVFAMFFTGIYFGVFIVDLCYSFNVANRIKAFAEERHLVVRWESLKRLIAEKAGAIKKNSFLFAFLSGNTLEYELRRYYCMHMADRTAACVKRMDRLHKRREKREEKGRKKAGKKSGNKKTDAQA